MVEYLMTPISVTPLELHLVVAMSTYLALKAYRWILGIKYGLPDYDA